MPIKKKSGILLKAPYIYIYIYKQDLVLNNKEGFICHKTQPMKKNGLIYINTISICVCEKVKNGVRYTYTYMKKQTIQRMCITEMLNIGLLSYVISVFSKTIFRVIMECKVLSKNYFQRKKWKGKKWENFSVNHFFFVLLSGDRAISVHWIILVSPHFSTVMSLL